jgi:Protein of unknown function (DUF3071)
MYELRVVALSEDARYVVLAPVLEGRRERYRVAVDERLRAALRGELGRLERKMRPDSALTPRQIQARVRAGETAETIAAAAGVAVEWVLRFETPVLAERAQVARQARHASLSVSGGEWTGVPLEEIVAARLEADGNRAEAADWDAWRRDDGRWVLQLRVGTFAAHWLWDPALARLVVHDESARSLLHPDSPVMDTAERAAEPRRLTLAPQPPEPLEPEVGVELRSATTADDGDLGPENADHDAASGVAMQRDVRHQDAGHGGHEEAGHEDAGHEDAGHEDAGHEDAGHEDAGHEDAGHEDAEGATAEQIAEPADTQEPTAPVPPADTTADLSAAQPAAEDATEPAAVPPTGADADAARARRSGRRKSVPSWEDILLGTGANPGTSTGSESFSG